MFLKFQNTKSQNYLVSLIRRQYTRKLEGTSLIGLKRICPTGA